MHHDDGARYIELLQRFLDHPPLNRRRGIREAFARAPAMPRAVDQNHAVAAGQQVAERMAHGLEVRTGAVNHHDRHAAARPNIDDVELPTRDLDQSALTRIEPIERNDPGLRDQRQNSQRHHQACEDHRRNPDCFLHARATILRQIGFGGKSRAVLQVRPIRQPAAASAVLRFRPGSTVPAGKPSGCCWRSRCPRPGNAASCAG